MDEKEPIDNAGSVQDLDPRSEAEPENQSDAEAGMQSASVPEAGEIDAPEAAGGASGGEEAPAVREEIQESFLDMEGFSVEDKASDEDAESERLRAVVEAAVYITDEPLTAKQIAEALDEPLDKVNAALDDLSKEYAKVSHGLTIRQLAEGYKMGTKAEHHEAIRSFVKKLQKPLKLSMAALETLAVIAYKQPITAPEVMEVRGVQGAGVLKTLLDRKLITTAGRKDVVGKPILYKTTKDFLVQFGLNNVKELPTLKEFEELARIALADESALAEESPETGAGPEPEQKDPVVESAEPDEATAVDETDPDKQRAASADE